MPERFIFSDLRELFAKANEEKSGDQLAGLAARSERERIAAKYKLADLPLAEIVQQPLIDPADDDVSRLILETFDQEAFGTLRSMTIGEFREYILDDATDEAELKRLQQAITPEIVAAVAKIMSNKDLVLASAKIRNVTRCRNTMGERGVLGIRVQPNHPSDDLGGILLAAFEGLLYGCGDAVIGVNPATDSLETVSSILRALNRLVEPTAGDVRVGGRAVTGADPATLRALRRQIGMVFQQFNLVRRASVLDNVLAGRLGWAPALPTLFGHFPAEDRRIALECLAQVGLADFAQRRADTLSGGEQQRVAIARALAQSPAVILADEPTASLDPALTGSIMDLLKTIRARRGLTLVVSQHQLETALAYATRVVGFRQGRVVFDGPPAALSPAVASTIYGEEPRRSPQGGHP